MKQLTLGTRKFEAMTKYTTIFTFVSVGNEFEFHFLYSSVCLCVCACQHAMHAQFNLGITDLWFVKKNGIMYICGDEVSLRGLKSEKLGWKNNLKNYFDAAFSKSSVLISENNYLCALCSSLSCD